MVEQPEIEQPEIEYAVGEVAALTEPRGTLRQIAEWPPDSPVSFVLTLAPRTRLGLRARRFFTERSG